MTQSKATKAINHIAVIIVRLAGAGIFLFLTWYALRYSQYMDPAEGEFPITIPDSMGWNLAFLMVVLLSYAVFRMSEHFLAKYERALKIFSGILLVAVIGWICVAGHWWITDIVRPPEGDQLYAYVAACNFADGHYEALLPESYCGIYPHQLGFTAILELLFKITGDTHFYQWQKFNVVCCGGIVILGYLLIKELGGRWADRVLYCILMAVCFPLIFYTSWIYGEILSILCSLTVAYLLLRYTKKRKTGWLIGVLPVAVLGMLVRKNFLILILAVVLAALVWSIEQRDFRTLIFAIAVLLLPLLSYQGIYRMYEIRSGYSHAEGLPVTSWISMGLQENQGRYGWYYDYPLTLYREAEGDTEAVAEVVDADIRDRLQMFSQDPAYTWTFFREKILSQWNEPLYQSLFFTTNFREENRPEPDSLAGQITVNGALFYRIFSICDRLQFVLYLGVLLYFVCAVKRDGNMLAHTLAITLIGGFLFSILWEAKARYMFPYYVTMYPIAVVGYRQLFTSIRSLSKRFGMARGAKAEDAEIRRVS